MRLGSEEKIIRWLSLSRILTFNRPRQGNHGTSDAVTWQEQVDTLVDQFGYLEAQLA